MIWTKNIFFLVDFVKLLAHFYFIIFLIWWNAQIAQLVCALQFYIFIVFSWSFYSLNVNVLYSILMRKIINKNIFQSYALLFILLYPSHPFLIYISHPISGTGTTSAQYIYSLHSQIRGENKNWQSAILSPQWNSMLWEHALS
jgi:hypothetical protein